MTYDVENLSFKTLLPKVALAEDQLARLDEIVRRSPVGEGFAERGHFLDAAASMWLSGELLHIEDLVFHDAHMDIRSPTHELVIGHGILRARRRVASAEPGWAVSEAGVAALTGAERITSPRAPGVADERGGEGGDEPPDEDDDPLSRELAHIDAVVAFPSQFQFEPLKGTATSCVPFLISCSSAQGYDLVALSTQSPAALVRFTRNRSRRR